MPRKKKPGAKVPKTRRPRGSGSSYFDKARDEWIGKVPVGKEPDGTNPKTGRPKTKTVYQYFRAPTRAKVEELMRGAKPPADTVTVGEWCDRWLAAKGALRNASVKAFRDRIELRIKPSLGATQVTKLTAWDIESALAKWEGGAATLNNTLSTLSATLRAAMRANLITANPAALVRRVKGPKVRKLHLFSRPELKRIVEKGLAHPGGHLFAVLALTGMRIGEAMALTPGDFDSALLRVSITKTWTPSGVQDEPKTAASRRTIDVCECLKGVLSKPWEASVNHYQSVHHRWTGLLEELKLEHRGPHQLRHSYASYAIADGVPVPDLAAYLGHSPEELLKTYAHPTGTDMRGVSARVVGL